MKRFILFCWILLAAFSSVNAQVKGCWMLEKEFIYLDDYDLMAFNSGKAINIRHYGPGSAVFALTVEMGGASANPPEVLMPGSYTPAQKAENERQWKEWEQASKGRAVTDEYELEWKINAPGMIYFGDEETITADFEIRRNGEPFQTPVKYSNNAVMSFSTGYSYAYTADGVTLEDTGGRLTSDQVRKLLDCSYEDLDDFFSEALDSDSMGYDGNESSAAKGTLRKSGNPDWRPDGVPNPHYAFLIVALATECQYKPSSGLPVDFTIQHLCFYKFADSDNIAITHEAGNTAGEDEGTDIPWWIVAPVAGVAVEEIIRRGSKKEKKEEKEEKEEEVPEPAKEEEPAPAPKKPSKFKMILAKEFGNTIKAADGPRRLGVRIEEIRPDGTRVKRPDLTERIQAQAGKNLSLDNSFFKGDYLFADVSANLPEGEKEGKGVITFTFFGMGGQLRNNVVFNVVDDVKEIIFQQENMTFIAGRKDEYNMAFRVLGFGDDESDLSFEINVQDKSSNHFELSGIRPHEEKGIWCFDIRDTAEYEDNPGRMDCFVCTVVAKHFDRKSGREKSLEGSFELYRFYEGLRLSVGHIRAYPVVKGTGGVKDTEKLPVTYDEPLEAPRTGVWVTLFIYDEKNNRLDTPAFDEAKFRIEDVPGSVQYFGKEGEEITDPCRMLGFDFDTSHSTVSGNLNTLYCDFAPHQFLMPPTRAQAKVTVEVRHNGRDFSASRTVMVYSMPKRPSDTSMIGKWKEEDERIEDDILHMRAQLLGRESAPQMRPLIHKLGLLLDSYDPEFGFYKVEYYYLKKMYMRFITGEIGPFYVNENVYNEVEVDWGDAFDATMEDCSKVFPDSFFSRLLIDFFTSGAAELYYTPRDFLLTCRAAANDGTQRDVWDNFKVGAKFGAVQYLMAWGCAEGLKKVGATQFGKALNEEFQMFESGMQNTMRELKAGCSHFAKAYRVTQSIRKVANMKVKFRGEAAECLESGRLFVDGSDEMKHLVNLNNQAKLAGKAKVDKFRSLCESEAATNQELMDAMMDISLDRFAKTELNNTKLVPDRIRWRYKMEKDILSGHMKPDVKKAVAEAYGVHESEVTFFEATGNSSKSAVSCKSAGMDLDYTIRVRGKDLPDVDAARFWDEALYRHTHGGQAADAAKMAQYAHDAEHTAVSSSSAEAFPKQDLSKITDKSKRYEKYEDAEGVAKTQTYKVQEHLNEAAELEHLARTSTNKAEADALMKKSIACYKEAARQYPKGLSRTFDSKLEAVYARGNGSKLNDALVNDAMKTRSIIELGFERDLAGDDSAIIEMMAYFEKQGSSLAKKAEGVFGMIPELNNLI